MPIPRNWVEELVLEWLLLRGYIVISNVRLKSGRRGGAKEADILGLKLLREGKKVLEIMHVETGSVAQNFDENLKNIRNKFSSERERTLEEISLDIIELKSAVNRANISKRYKRIYIASYVSRKQVDRLKEILKKDNIEFLTLEEVLRKIVKDIDKWKQNQARKGRRTTVGITLPESWWLLNLIDFIKSRGLMKCVKN